MPEIPAISGLRPLLAPPVVGDAPRTSLVRWGDRVVERPPGYVLGGAHAGERHSSFVDVRARERLAVGAMLRKKDLAVLLSRIDQMRQLSHVDVRELGEVAGHTLHAVHFGSLDAPKLRVLVTAGVHGNEVSGPGAAALLMDQLLAHPELRQRIDFTIVPCVNPVGFVAGTRKNGDDLDINRCFSDSPDVPIETALTRRLLQRGDYDLVLDLHSAKSSRQGFFALHRNGAGLLATAMARFSRDHAVLGKRGGSYVYEAPGIYHSNNRHTLKDYAVDRGGASTAITLEAPRSFSYAARVTGLANLVHDIVVAAEVGGLHPG